MKAGERLLLIFMTLVFTVICIFIASCMWSAPLFDAVKTLSDVLYIKIAVSAVLLALIILSVRAAFVSAGSAKKPSTLAATTAEGGIYISIDTIDELAQRAVKRVNGVKETHVRSFMVENGVSVTVKTAFSPEIVIPDASAEVQQNVKNDIETLCGIAVSKVNIQVDNTVQQKA